MRQIYCDFGGFMERLFDDTRPTDKIVREKFGLSEDLMMENAAVALERHLMLSVDSATVTTLIACGGGDNGGDGYALARRFRNCIVWSVLPPKSPSCIRQKERAEKIGVRIFTGDVATFKREFAFDTIGDKPVDDDSGIFGRFDAVVDCIFGSGFHGEPDESVAEVIRFLNGLKAKKVACDVPSCLSCADASQRNDIFKANTTVTMGALKKILYADYSKDYVGEVYCMNLGVTRALFESLAINEENAESAQMWLLEKKDFAPPKRIKQCVHKGTYGHGAILIGEKRGAGIIAGEACFAYGAGLVTLVACDGYRQPDSEELSEIPCSPAVMTNTQLPANTTAVALGMGLGRSEQAKKDAQERLAELTKLTVSCVLDADIFYMESLPKFLAENCGKKHIVLTPHPKEFLSLLKICGLLSESALEAASAKSPKAELADMSVEPQKAAPDFDVTGQNQDTVEYVIKNRDSLSAAFCKKYPGVVLLVKGATPLISTMEAGKLQQFVNPHGKNCLAKGGSGDVLSGLICALLAQGYTALNAAIQGSLAHSHASERITTDYGMTPFMLIDAARYLESKYY